MVLYKASPPAFYKVISNHSSNYQWPLSFFLFSTGIVICNLYKIVQCNQVKLCGCMPSFSASLKSRWLLWRLLQSRANCWRGNHYWDWKEFFFFFKWRIKGKNTEGKREASEAWRQSKQLMEIDTYWRHCSARLLVLIRAEMGLASCSWTELACNVQQ